MESQKTRWAVKEFLLNVKRFNGLSSGFVVYQVV